MFIINIIMKSDSQRKAQIEQFIKNRDWKWYEKWQSQPFWIDLLWNVLWVENPVQFIEFEDHVKIDKANWFIDAFIPTTKVLIEQKWKDRNLREAIKQSDGSLLNPFQQAKRYSAELPYDKRPRWIITCNFQSFLVYDMNNPNSEPEEILLKNLVKEYYRLSFIVDTKAEHIKKEEEMSFMAGELIWKIYDAFSKQYSNLENKESQKSLNELCVRLVFCFYAEDSWIFWKKDMFHDYLTKYENDLDTMRSKLIELFKVLDTKYDDRDPYLSNELAQFPYVNWWLFSNENIEIPRFTDDIKNLILSDASIWFDWSDISPTIFWAVFESTLNQETRRKWWMHYTSIENIHKVIDPLFLNDLRDELDSALAYKRDSDRKKALVDFQNHIASLKFFDPACWSGNFLTETYLSLRRLENEAIKAYWWAALNPDWIIKVNINQFYWIEINDFAVKVATTALWIAESQTVKETEKIIWTDIDFLPLKSYTNIREWNALRIDWNEVISNKECSFIMGNPPFIGRRYRSEEQQNDISMFFKYKDIDYVACWFCKAAEYAENTNIRIAFVATNSITQWEQVSALWRELWLKYRISIIFAYRTFKWNSESNLKANVNVVIIWLGYKYDKKKYIFDDNIKIEAKNINWYLLNAPNVFVDINSKPLCDVPPMKNGNVPLDWDALKIEPEDLHKFSNCPYIKQLMWWQELLHNEKRYVIWLVWVSPSEIKKYPEVVKRIELCRENRLAMKDKWTKKLAETPTTFRDTNNPDNYIALPMVSSESRRYVPMAYLRSDVIPTNQIQTIPNASIYHFWVLNSNVHMSRMRAVAWRLEMRYRYSKDIVYNNFPWPEPTDEQRKKIESTGLEILKARNLYPDCSLADLYDENFMPKELRVAHQHNDRAVMEAYWFDWKNMKEPECVAELMLMYEKLVKENQ